MRVLLTGAGGQLGTDVSLAADGNDEIELMACDRAALDITDAAAVVRVFDQAGPQVVLHAAAFTAVDVCETEEAATFAVNATGTENVVAAAEAVGAKVIYVSTDYVFDGSKDSAYVESDAPNPASVYGRSKLAGEQAMRSDDVIVRTSWVCGSHGANMVKTILRLAESHPTLTFVDDQIGKPSFTADLAQVLLTMVGRPDLSGITHVTNEGVASWYGFCGDVLAAAGQDRSRVLSCATHELQPPRPAPRPANSVLANTRFAEFGLPLLRDYHEPLKETVADLTS